MSKRRAAKPGKRSDARGVDFAPKIIGGRLKGKRIEYSGDTCTRPMKHRVREAVFNLVGVETKDRHAIDLFAGTGAMGIEALSRGARFATFVERHFPTAAVLQRNVESLSLQEVSEVCSTSVLLWLHRLDPDAIDAPWTLFFCPPYEMYQSDLPQVLGWIDRLIALAPAGSTLVVEADTRFDFESLPQADQWDVRKYAPAVVGVWRKSDPRAAEESRMETPASNPQP